MGESFSRNFTVAGENGFFYPSLTSWSTSKAFLDLSSLAEGRKEGEDASQSLACQCVGVGTSSAPVDVWKDFNETFLPIKRFLEGPSIPLLLAVFV